MASSIKGRLLIVGGGTGGHCLNGVAVANAWMSHLQCSSDSILFVGGKGGIEENLIPKNGFNLKVITIGGLNRVGLLKKLSTLYQLPFAFIDSFRILLQFKPQAVLGIGGYASGPVVLIAKILGYYTSFIEPNAVPGLTNRILGKFVSRIFTALPLPLNVFGRDVKVIGNPIRKEFIPLDRPTGKFTVFIFGGSLGAVGMNTLVIESLQYLTDLKDKIHFVHQTGKVDYERVRDAYMKAEMDADVQPFMYDMKDRYATASLIVSRSGASTLAEIAAVGRASILVPLPTASDNHQEKNAFVFVNNGAALLVKQKESTGQTIADLLHKYYLDQEALWIVAEKAKRFAKLDAAVECARTIDIESSKVFI